MMKNYTHLIKRWQALIAISATLNDRLARKQSILPAIDAWKLNRLE